MSVPTTVEDSSDVTVTAAGPLRHLCPHRDEVDRGSVTITWRTAGQTFELHALAEYLLSWRTAKVSHEEITDRIAFDLHTVAGVELITVETRWQTAGLEVTCSTSPTPAAPSQSPQCAPDASV